MVFAVGQPVTRADQGAQAGVQVEVPGIGADVEALVLGDQTDVDEADLGLAVPCGDLEADLGVFPLALVVGEEDGKGDVVGVLPDNLLEAVAVSVLRTFFVEVEEDGGTSEGTFGRLDLEAGLAVGCPLPCPVFTSLARDDFHLVSDHEGGVEADAKLADEVGIFALVARELR